MTQNYYSFPASKVTHDNALRLSSEASFAGIQGHLWVPNSKVEIQAVLSDLMFRRLFRSDRVLCAISDTVAEGNWVVTAGPHIGTDMSALMVWWWNEPNGGTAENCVIAWSAISSFIDVPCTDSNLYVVEYECPFGQRFNDQGTACIGLFYCCN